MHTYMQDVTSQQAPNHMGQVQLNKTFYQYTMHQQSQDPSPFPWPTPEQFGATVAWTRDEPNFETGARSAGAPRAKHFIFLTDFVVMDICEDNDIPCNIRKVTHVNCKLHS